MNRIIYVTLCLAAAAGITSCGVARRASTQQQSAATVHEDTSSTHSTAVDIITKIDSSRTSATEITYTKIEYYPPQPPTPSDEGKQQDPAEVPGENGCPLFTPSGLTTATGTETGGVKSIEQVTIRHTESAGASGSTAAKLQEDQQQAAVRDSTGSASAKTESIREPDKEAAGASKRWATAVIAIAAVAAGVLLLILLRKSGAFSWLRAKLQK